MSEPIPGYLVQHFLADGRVVAVLPTMFGQGRLIIGDEIGVHELWDYATVAEAIVGYAGWDPLLHHEPTGWVRHPSTGRRRPDGDPSKEYVHP